MDNLDFIIDTSNPFYRSFCNAMHFVEDNTMLVQQSSNLF